ncbi:hypothetical protein LMG7974_00617 [Campylobacter majalis]|uniref:16S rRNA (Guanine(966)-N(2))-methyltransferase RsmD n=1 Tax=Campylobacter majalis TaxID=2790656 RepID=A0ABM8Q4C4_9BACT|nr:RsmD family RNA methyltransferase [Campylobacter majalis]CAD7287736.1 hypothetical protein LMG7974_00617 [Campylobacter majalis]
MKLYTQISSGKFKGKKLQLPSLNTTRSTKSLVKSSFFDTVRYELSNSVFIEGFGGSGVMACEALSNGALKSYAIEKDKNAYKLTQSNLKSIDENLLNAIFGDSFEILPDLIASQNCVILYLDPPFDFRDGFDMIYQKLIDLIKKIDRKKIKMIVFEHSSKFCFDENLDGYVKIKSKKFGATTLTYFA